MIPIDLQFIFNTLYIILLVQGVLVLGVIIMILLDVKNATGAFLMIGNSIERVTQKAEKIIDDTQRSVEQMISLRNIVDFVKSMFFAPKPSRYEDSSEQSTRQKIRKRI